VRKSLPATLLRTSSRKECEFVRKGGTYLKSGGTLKSTGGEQERGAGKKGTEKEPRPTAVAGG